MAVYGPFVKTKKMTASDPVFRRQVWYRQTAPYVKRLTYDLDTYYPGPKNARGYSFAESWAAEPLDGGWAQSESVRKARDRLRDAISDRAELGVAIAEWKQSLTMIEKRGLQLYHFLKAARKGRFGDAAKALRLDPSSPRVRGMTSRSNRVRRTSRDLGSVVLEWNFGWAPLVDDIASAIEVLQSPVKNVTVRGRGSADDQRRRRNHGPYWSEVISTYRVRCQILTDVSVSNPNLWLANQLGFVNPASFAWELIPFSFLVDWFVPVGDFLSQWTDFVGLNLHEPTTTLLGQLDEYHDNYYGWRGHKIRVQMQRRPGIASFALQPARVTGLSAKRGLNAISLLLQQLREIEGIPKTRKPL